MQGIAEICSRHVEKAIEGMDRGGNIVGSGVLAKVSSKLIRSPQ